MQFTRLNLYQWFSLIEMIAVLAVIAIMAAALLPMMIKRIDIATRNQEITNLSSISNFLAQYVQRDFRLPAPAAWEAAAVSASSLPASQLSTNTRRYNRVCTLRLTAIDMSMFLQDENGTPQPQSARAVLVSLLGGDSPSALPNPATVTTEEFNALWTHRNGERPTEPWRAGTGAATISCRGLTTPRCSTGCCWSTGTSDPVAHY
jgi:prepilin-type N-terminal cleavage/methylation domain-containing protein